MHLYLIEISAVAIQLLAIGETYFSLGKVCLQWTREKIKLTTKYFLEHIGELIKKKKCYYGNNNIKVNNSNTDNNTCIYSTHTQA